MPWANIMIVVNRLSIILGMGLCAILATACSPGMVRSSRNALGLFQGNSDEAKRPSKKLIAQSDELDAVHDRLPISTHAVSQPKYLEETSAFAQWEEVDGYMILMIGKRLYVVPTADVAADDPA